MRGKQHEIIEHILDIIGYEGDKAAFSERFVQTCVAKAAAVVPIENPGFADELSKATTALFEDYLRTIIPALLPAEKEELKTYLASLQPVG